jgi:FkbM family methyltransferase
MGLEVTLLKNANIESQVLKRVLQFTEISVVLDVGANIGQFAELVFETGFTGTVISFEAIPKVHQRLLERAREKKSQAWVVAACSAIGNRRGTAQINVSANTASSSLLPMLGAHLDAAPESAYIEQQTIDIDTLDALADKLVPPAGKILIKVDTQGYEKQVLEGAEALLHRTAAIQLELSLVPLYAGAPTLVEMISFAESKGFELFSMVPGFRDRASGRLLQMDGFFVRPHSRP